jgi:hypothetical protein
LGFGANLVPYLLATVPTLNQRASFQVGIPLSGFRIFVAQELPN